MIQKQNKGKILSNKLCQEDLFEGKPHERLADTIVEEIKRDEPFSFIGLDGAWGSGKSNLIKIVETKLDKEKEVKYHFFTYDAWEHQTDLPRRTILEELIKDLIVANEILKKDDWEKKLQDLLAKKKRTNTITVPAIGCGTIISLFAIFLTPFLTHLASLINCGWGRLTVLIVPYVLAYTWAFCKTYKMTKNQVEEFGEKFTIKKFFSNFFLIYKDQIKENSTYETISEEEPSSQQFKKWFLDINNNLENGKCFLVIVFDNMDRLPKEKVRELWAVILSFFSGEEYSNICIIVPFDRSHLRSSFQSENIVLNNATQEVENNDAINYADDFINKTFSVVYCVPPPIMTGWVSYFKNKWKDAFGNDAVVDNSVLQIYDILTKELTPRKIIAFINQFVTIRNNCDPEIEDKYIALYILGHNKIKGNPLKEILEPSYLGSLGFLYENDEKMSQRISSLYYQLPMQSAMDVIYTHEIARELNENDINLLNSLKGTSQYWTILFHSIIDVVNIENVTFALHSHFKDEESIDIQRLWDALYHKCKNSNFNDTLYKEYHSILMSHISDKGSYYKYLLAQYHEHIKEDFDINNYINGVDRLQEIIGDKDDGFILQFKTKVKPKDYFILIKKRGEKLTKYGLVVNAGEFDDYISKLPEGKIATEKIYPYTKNVVPTPNYVKKIKDIFKREINIIPLESLIDRIKEVEERPFNINSYWDNNKIMSIAKGVKKGEKLHPDILAIVIATLDRQGYSNLGNFYFDQLNSEEENLVKSVASVIEYYLDYGTLLLCLPKHKDKKLVVAVAKELTIHKYGECYKNVNVKPILSSFGKIVEVLNIKSSKLLDRLNDCDATGLKINDVKTIPIYLFDVMQEVDNELSRRCLELADSYLQQTSQEEWETSLYSIDSFKLKLFDVYHPHKLPLCFDAFKKLMMDYAIGASITSIPTKNVETLIDIYESVGRDLTPIFIDIRDIFINNSNITKEKLKYFGKWLLIYGDLGNNQDSLGKIFQSQFLDDDIVKILIENPDSTKKMVDKAKNPADFNNKMSALLTTKYKIDDGFKSLCVMLNIK